MSPFFAHLTPSVSVTPPSPLLLLLRSLTFLHPPPPPLPCYLQLPIFTLPPHPFKTINDWYDREIDAINEPNRPIPSGAISEQQVRGGGILGEGKNSKQETDQRVKEG